MAAVVTTTSITRSTVIGDRRMVTAKLTFDTGDYADGGVAVTASQFGLQVLDTVIPLGPAFTADAANPVSWDDTNNKLIFWEVDTAADGVPLQEKAAEAMLAATLHVIVIGY